MERITKQQARERFGNPDFFDDAWEKAIRDFKLHKDRGIGPLTIHPGLCDYTIFVVRETTQNSDRPGVDHRPDGAIMELACDGKKMRAIGFYNSLEEAIENGFRPQDKVLEYATWSDS